MSLSISSSTSSMYLIPTLEAKSSSGSKKKVKSFKSMSSSEKGGVIAGIVIGVIVVIIIAIILYIAITRRQEKMKQAVLAQEEGQVEAKGEATVPVPVPEIGTGGMGNTGLVAK